VALGVLAVVLAFRLTEYDSILRLSLEPLLGFARDECRLAIDEPSELSKRFTRRQKSVPTRFQPERLQIWSNQPYFQALKRPYRQH
jgi:hypothetical protein